MPPLCELYPGICLKTEEKARRNLLRDNRRVPVGTVKTEYTEQNNYELEGMKYETVADSYRAYSSNSSGRIEGNQRGLYCCLQIEQETF